MTPATWYDLGHFRILAKPLHTNEHWTTYHIYLGKRFIAASLSRPSLQQCEDRLAESNLPEPARASTWQGWSFSTSSQRRSRPGRPRKADAERELQEAIEAG